MYMHVCVHAWHTFVHTNDGGFPKKSSLSNFAFFTNNNEMWDLPRDCQRQITGGPVNAYKCEREVNCA